MKNLIKTAAILTTLATPSLADYDTFRDLYRVMSEADLCNKAGLITEDEMISIMTPTFGGFAGLNTQKHLETAIAAQIDADMDLIAKAPGQIRLICGELTAAFIN